MKSNGNGMLVQYGCGFSAPAGWRNFDASPTLRFERLPFVGRFYSRNGNRFPANVEYGDIVKGLPLAHGTCSAIYASHVLEHLELQDFQRALANTYKLLESGGLFRLVVPDLQVLAKRYVDSQEPLAAVQFMKETSLGIESRSRSLAGSFRSWLGNSSHLWMWDFQSLSEELRAVGFVDIRRCNCGDEPVFAPAEDPNRFIDSIAVQCGKR